MSENDFFPYDHDISTFFFWEHFFNIIFVIMYSKSYEAG